MNMFQAALKMADQTPENRNRYVDFLRALSIGCVITGHWLIATAFFDVSTGKLLPVDVLSVIPSTQWLTWLFQVMPIFFIVGGYSNAISIESSRNRNQGYAEWLYSRLHRLLTPLLVLVGLWAVVSASMFMAGVEQDTIRFATKAALVPTWFLAIYTMIVLLAPLSYSFWKKWGWYSFFVFVALAAVMDVLFFQFEVKWPSWSNYFWVWLAVHHLGFAWFDGKLGKPQYMLALGLAGIAALAYLTLNGPYPLAMAGSPDEAISNSLPPKFTLIVLGIAQFGILHALQTPMRKLLAKRKVWAATVLINSMIMTVYLWHMTVLIMVFGITYYADGWGMTYVAGSNSWWLTRPIWLASLGVCLSPFALGLSFLERTSKPEGVVNPSPARLVIGSCMAGLGIALASLNGFSGDIGSLDSWAALLLLVIGSFTCGLKIFPSIGRRGH